MGKNIHGSAATTGRSVRLTMQHAIKTLQDAGEGPDSLLGHLLRKANQDIRAAQGFAIDELTTELRQAEELTSHATLLMRRPTPALRQRARALTESAIQLMRQAEAELDQ